MRFQELGYRLRVADMPLHAQRQRLDPGDGEERVDRRHRRTQVAQAYGVAVHRHREVAERLVEAQSVIGRLGLAQARKLVVLRPVETAAVDHHRSEEHTSELQSLMRISYAVFCVKKKTKTTIILYT